VISSRSAAACWQLAGPALAQPVLHTRMGTAILPGAGRHYFFRDQILQHDVAEHCLGRLALHPRYLSRRSVKVFANPRFLQIF
jgi:hypothetical protein